MDAAEFLRLLLMILLALGVGAAIYIVLYPYFSGEKQAGKRLQGIAVAKSNGPKGRPGNSDPNNARRKQVAETLKELEERQSAKQKLSLRQRLERAGINSDAKGFWTWSAFSGAICAILVLFFIPGAPFFVAIVAAFIGCFGLPRWVLSKMTKRRQNKFLDEFANCIDIVVRGVKSGLPLNECLSIIARESPQPISGEFALLVEQQRVGVPLADCFERMIDRMPLSEVKFFAIVISIQQQAGGNLSEALGNLSGVLRDRKKMQAKVKALSAEAKASAGVLASLPFIVAVLVYLSTPKYISILWTTPMGKFVIVVAGIWMTFGVLVMRKMINFKF